METTTFIANPKVKIALVRAAKGYRWTVEVTHEDPDEALAILDRGRVGAEAEVWGCLEGPLPRPLTSPVRLSSSW
jgi:hypothetical protein